MSMVPLEALASSNGDSGFFRELEALPESIPREDRKRKACSAWASRRLRMIKELLRRGARPNGRGGEAWSPLMSAVAYGLGECDNAAVIKELLAAGADPDHRMVGSYGSTRPLLLAVEGGTSAAVGLLLQYGADANIPDDNGLTPLMLTIVADRPVGGDNDDGSYSGGCSNSDNSNVRKFKLLLPKTDLSRKLSATERSYKNYDYIGLTAPQILARRLADPDTPGDLRCLERMRKAMG
jgi:ankyrin repeat protein